MLTERLSEIQIQTLKAAVNRVIPADDYPGGWDAGVGDFLATLLTREPSFLLSYQTGLNGLHAEAGPSGFAALSSEAQDALLARLEAENNAFFQLLIMQTMEGFYADPTNGGNRDEVTWRMIGFEVTA